MTLPELTFTVETGDLQIGGLIGAISSNDRKANVEGLLGDRLRDQLDHGNGYAWLYFDRLAFGARPCGLGVCFHHDLTVGLMWSVSMIDFTLRPPYRSREEVETEIAFVRGVLAAQLNRTFEKGFEDFPWGRVGCSYDDKSGGIAHSFVHYPGW